jgi:hypothetical protein
LRETRNGVNISTFNLNRTTNYSSTDFTDNNNNWTAAEFHNANKDDAALEAHWGTEMTYDYFKQVHNRNSWNGSGGALLSYVHYDINYSNAFWNGQYMTYGDGNGGTIDTYVCLDVIAHEIGHGILQSETNYTQSSGEFGAINESLSDIWGACVENYVNTTYGLNKDIWLQREEVGLPNRSLSNPNIFIHPDTYGGDFWDNNGAVHTNSGVGNFWFFLLSQGGNGTNDIGNAYSVTGIGITKAARIVYRAETSYLTSSANYAQFRNATISAAINLYGQNSAEVIATTNAWHAVGVGNPYLPSLSGPTYFNTTGTFTLNGTIPTGATIAIHSSVPYTRSGNTITLNASGFDPGTGGIYAVITLHGVSYTLPPCKFIYGEFVPNFVIGKYDAGGLHTGYGWCASNMDANWLQVDMFAPDYLLLLTDMQYQVRILRPNGTVEYTFPFFCRFNYAGMWHAGGTVTNPYSMLEMRNVTYNLNSEWQRMPDYIYSVTCPSSSYSMGFVASPNPVSDVLNVTIDPTAFASQQQSSPGSQLANPARTFDIRLYNSNGVTVRQASRTGQGSTQINVSGLPNGLYVLHIHDGSNQPPQTQQIVVAH